MIHLLVALLSMRVFADISKEAWPKRRIWVNIESLVYVKELSISFINCAQEGAYLIGKQWAVKKNRCVCFNIKAHEQNGFKVSGKLCLNLCLRKWLRPRCSLVRDLIPLQLWQLNTLFADGLINFYKFFLKTLRLVALPRLGSNLFHSITVDGKKEFLKKLCLVWKRVILSASLVLKLEFFCWY